MWCCPDKQAVDNNMNMPKDVNVNVNKQRTNKPIQARRPWMEWSSILTFGPSPRLLFQMPGSPSDKVPHLCGALCYLPAFQQTRHSRPRQPHPLGLFIDTGRRLIAQRQYCQSCLMRYQSA